MGNNGKGIGPQGLGYAKSMAKKSYGSMAKQTKKVEPKTGGFDDSNIDTFYNDSNNDGNMVSRAANRVGAFMKKNFPMEQSYTRPMFKDGKLNFDASLMDNVATGLTTPEDRKKAKAREAKKKQKKSSAGGR